MRPSLAPATGADPRDAGRRGTGPEPESEPSTGARIRHTDRGTTAGSAWARATDDDER